MRIQTPPKRVPGESVIPMINVVFLLLIFFLMTAQIAPPDPFDVTPPTSEVEAAAQGQRVLHVSVDGELAYEEARGEDDVLAALEDFAEDEPLLLRADRGVPAEKVAALLPKLAKAGVRNLKLVSATQ